MCVSACVASGDRIACVWVRENVREHARVREREIGEGVAFMQCVRKR